MRVAHQFLLGFGVLFIPHTFSHPLCWLVVFLGASRRGLTKGSEATVKETDC